MIIFALGTVYSEKDIVISCHKDMFDRHFLLLGLYVLVYEFQTQTIIYHKNRLISAPYPKIATNFKSFYLAEILHVCREFFHSSCSKYLVIDASRSDQNLNETGTDFLFRCSRKKSMNLFIFLSMSESSLPDMAPSTRSGRFRAATECEWSFFNSK